MAKTGDVATRFGIHADTIREWGDLFEDFFSPGARRGAGTQRIFTEQDEILINTINELRKQRVDFEQIRARLAGGERIPTLPLINEPVPQESALAVYTELRELRTRISDREAEIERLRQENKEEREGSAKLREELAVLRYRLKKLGERVEDE